jgi:hypothetical protein
MDVPIMLKREEFAIRMAQRGNSAAMRDAPMEPFEEEYVGYMAQKWR